MSTYYDAIIIGTGAGGGTLALHLAQAGKKILVLERGPFLPQERLNWDTSAVFLDNRYHTRETWLDKDGGELHPQQAYYVGGQTKVYGAAMFRLRVEDFGVLHHKGGISPAWPISYADMEPYYTRAEELFHVHGSLGANPPAKDGGLGSEFDPTEPFHSRPYPYAAFTNEPRMQAIEEDVRKLGVRTFPIPLGLKRNEADPVASPCVRCDTCDGYPCLVHAKSDSDINCIRRIMHLPNVTLMTESRVTRLITNAAGTEIAAVEVVHSGPGADPKGELAQYSGSIVAVCAGAVNSAALLLQSANDKHPHGLANASDQVGRNFMYHQADAILALSLHDKNEDSYTKTWGTNDFYLRDPDGSYEFPLGQVQPIGSFHAEMMQGDAPFFTPGVVLENMRHHAVPWWLTTEDLPDPDNRVTVRNTTPGSIPDSIPVQSPGPAGAHGASEFTAHNFAAATTVAAPGQITLSYTPNNVESFKRLQSRWLDVLRRAGHAEGSVPLHAYFKKRIPLEGVGHQNGTCRMGADPATSVLDIHCKTHEIDNLYVVDASFFPSAGAVNPSLTIIANAIRVADHLLTERLS
ncbi:GMC family oxidoreductase [Granulicella sp. WH15]|uniref:GMC oxidoreductase n=1 Tax=Granulicella sp. WH15 TaxID=2602070 RepID=UPI00136791F4|nr:GMC family oxidoreductase [Granulicella sp. WH15]QHN05162.1 GMC family oxidoreductase [Granulicella sp. WH15]